MSSPTIPDLPSATVVNDSDQCLIRQPAGALGTDKKVTAALLRQINIAGYANLPSNPEVTDLMAIQRGSGLHKIRFDQVSFIPGTQMWFYQNTAPSGWSTITSGDTLLAVKGGTSYATGGTTGGTWQQDNHILDVTQIPAHTHTYTFADSSAIGTKASRPPRQFEAANANSGITASTGGGAGHNHGALWRPLASVGVLCVKDSI